MAIRPELGDISKLLVRPEVTDVPPDQLLEHQQVAAEIILKDIFPKYFETLLKVSLNGTQFPSKDEPRWVQAEIESKVGGYFSTSIRALVGREATNLFINGENLGMEVGRIYVSDGIDSIIFHLVGSDIVVYENGNLEDSATVLKDASSIFNPVKKRNTFRKGIYPAVWINEMEKRKVMENISEQVSTSNL